MNKTTVKQTAARLVRLSPVRGLMHLAIKLVVPRQRIGVAVVLLDDRGHVLLLRHVFHPFTPWGLPGGWLGRRESPADCALRELREETEVVGTLGPVIHISRETAPPSLNIAYLAYVRPGPLQLSGEIIEAAWFSPDNLPGPLLAFTHRSIQAAAAHAAQFNGRVRWPDEVADYLHSPKESIAYE